MALIICPACGKQVSDQASVCPHCGNSIAQQPTNLMPGNSSWGANTPNPAQGSKNKIMAIAGISIALVVAVVAVLIILVLNNGSGGNNNVLAPNDPNPVVQTDKDTVYDVYLSVSCKQNAVMNKYNIDILVDGQAVDTLAHGTSNSYHLYLSKGSHLLMFRLNDSPEHKSTTSTLNVTGDMSVSYNIKCTLGNNIEASRQ